MQRKMTLQNTRFQQRKQPLTVIKTMTLDEFLRSDEVRKLIVEFIIFSRACTSLTIYSVSKTNFTTYVNLQNKYYSQLLIKNICNLQTFKSNNFQKSIIKEKIKFLLKKLSLSKQNNDEWTLKYLAHFFESNSQLRLFFYDSPFYKLKETAYTASPISMRKGISFPGYQESYERHNLLFDNGIPQTIILFHYWSQSIFQILALLSGCFAFFKLVNLLPPIVEEPALTYLNIAVSIYCSFRIMGKLLRYVIQNSPYSWDAAGAAIKIGLIDEIDSIMSPLYNTYKGNTKLSPSASPDYFSSTTSNTSAPKATLFTSSFANDQKILPDDHKSTEKRKHQSTASQSFLALKNTTRVKIKWEDSAIPSLEGIVVDAGKGKHDIDIIPTSGFSRGWSTNRSLNASCKHHFFYQPENKNSTQDPIASEFSNLISVAHVVPPTAHAGLVPLQPNDSDFCGARYKVKAFLQSIATMRVGLFFASRSKPLEVIGNSKSYLPESLKNEKFYLHIPGKPKRTH